MIGEICCPYVAPAAFSASECDRILALGQGEQAYDGGEFETTPPSRAEPSRANVGFLPAQVKPQARGLARVGYAPE